MIHENFLSLRYDNDEDREPSVYEHHSLEVAEIQAREVLLNLPIGAYIVIVRVESVMHVETRIVKNNVTKSTPQVAGHAS